MTDQTAPEHDWPREIWAFAIDRSKFEMSGAYATSEHATVPRWEGDPERDRPVKEYVDRDILDSLEKYCQASLSSRADIITTLEAENARLREALVLCRDDLDAYSQQEYPLDHPVHERYRKRDYDANPARAALEQKGSE